MKKEIATLLLLATFWFDANARCIECGNWALDRSDGSGGYLEIAELDGKTIFKLEVRAGGDAPNQGLVSGSIRFHKGFAQYSATAPACHIDFKFANSLITITSHRIESFECGFANGVIADGSYSRISK